MGTLAAFADRRFNASREDGSLVLGQLDPKSAAA
jgi:hypothetical protein